MTERVAHGLTLVMTCAFSLGLAQTPLLANSIIATADTEGYIGPCENCPGGTGFGSIARRYHAIQHWEDGNPLLLDAGNFLFGPQSAKDRGEFIAGAYQKMGYRVVNAVPSDFRHGAELAKERFQETGAQVVSANLRDGAGEPLFQAATSLEHDGLSWTIIGLSAQPAPWEEKGVDPNRYPNLTVAPPADVLSELLPTLAATDRTIVLYHGGPEGFREIREAGGDRVDLWITGGFRSVPDALKEQLIAPPRHGTALIVIDPQASPLAPGKTHSLGPDQPSAEISRDGASLLHKLPSLAGMATERDIRPLPGDFDWSSEGEGALLSFVDNLGWSLTVNHLEIKDRFGEVGPETEGNRFVIFSTIWTNRIPLAYPMLLDKPEGVQVDSLPRQLFLIANHTKVFRPAIGNGAPDNAIPERFAVWTRGDSRSGRVAFEIPPDFSPDDLELRFYHNEFAPVGVLITGKPAEKKAEDEILGDAYQSNEVAGLIMNRFEWVDEWNGVEAAPGKRLLAVDLLGRGRLPYPTPALAMDLGADPDEMVDNPRVIPYTQAADFIRVVHPDGYYYGIETAQTPMPENWYLLPDLYTGYTLVFSVPEQAADSVDLAAYFPLMATTTGGRLDLPDPLRFPLSRDAGPAVPAAESIEAFQDGEIHTRLVSVETVNQWGTELQAEDGQELWVFALELTNQSENNGLFPLGSRTQVRAQGQVSSSPLAVTDAWGNQVESVFVLPVNEPVRLHFVHAVPADAQTVELQYGGTETSQTIALSPDDTEGEDSDSQIIASRESTPPDSASSAPSSTPSTPPREQETVAPSQAADEAVDEMAEAPDLPLPDFTAETLPMDTEAHPLQHPIDLQVRGQNDILELSITRAHVFNNIHGVALEDGKVVLGLDLRIQRRDDPENPGAPQIDGDVPVRRLADFLWAVRDFGRFHEIHRIRDCPLQISERFNLRQPGQAESGFLYFEISPEALAHFELHWLDPEHGNITLPVFPLGRDVLDSPAPLHAGENDIAAIEVYRLQTRDLFLERDPRRDEWLVLDLRGRSLRRSAPEVPEKSPVEMLLNWRDWDTRFVLILDGDRVYDLDNRSSDQPDPWPLLPMRPTGAELGFDLPKGAFQNAESAELVIGFGPHYFPGRPVRTPEPIRIMLKGERVIPEVPDEVMAKFEDMDQDFIFHGFSEPESIEGNNQSGPWLLASFTVTAKRDEGVVFVPEESMQLLTRQRSPLNARLIIWGGSSDHDSRSSSQWIPPGDSRTFQAAWRTGDHNPQEMRLRYAGTKLYESIPLGTPDISDPASQPDLPEENPLISERGVKVLSPEREPEGIAGVGLKPEEVNGAIDRGRDFLWQQLRQEIERRGVLRGRRYTIISLYALVNTDAHREYPLFDEALREYLHWVNPNDLNVYENGLLAMILRAYGDPGLYEKLEQVTRYLVEAQGENGTWSYTANVPDFFFPQPEADAEAAAGPFEILGGGPPPEIDPEAKETGPIHRTQSFTLGSEGDNSCTQFAVLGLWSAQRAGIEVDPDVWTRNLRSATSFQNLNFNDSFGGYGYRTRSSAYGSMTAAVLCTTAIGMRQLDADVKISEHLRIRNALGWLVENFAVDENPVNSRWNYYYLYSLERVGQILGTEFIGEHEWYPLGARYLVDRQSGDGSWPQGPSESNNLLTTSYALLFLVRATPQMDEEIVPEPEPEGPGRLVTAFTRPPPPPRLYLIFDASGSMRAPIDGKMKFDIARDAVRDLVEVLPEGTEFALRVYGHRHRANQEEAVTDSALELPFRPVDKDLVNQTLDRLRPVGRTPLAYSLDEALRDVGRGRGQRETLVLLLTDGGDDTRSNPVASAQSYAALENVQFHVLGFDINRPNWTRQLEQMAEASGGWYHPVAEAADLTRDLQTMVSPPPPRFEIFDNNGDLVAGERFGGEEIELEPGEYQLKTLLGDRAVETTFWIRPGSSTRLTFDWQQAATP